MVSRIKKINISVVLRTERGVPTVLLTRILTKLEDAIYASELKELDEIAEHFPEIPTVAIDAARYRISDQRGHCLRIVTASEGSIVLYGTVACVALWLLNTTLGEMLKEAWRKSDLHKRLLDYLGSKIRFRDKCIDLGKEGVKKINRDRKLKDNPPRIHHAVGEEEDGIELVYEIVPGEEINEPPTADELLGWD